LHINKLSSEVFVKLEIKFRIHETTALEKPFRCHTEDMAGYNVFVIGDTSADDALQINSIIT